MKGSAQDQHDAHEFFLLFLDKLAELKIRNKNGAPSLGHVVPLLPLIRISMPHWSWAKSKLISSRCACCR